MKVDSNADCHWIPAEPLDPPMRAPVPQILPNLRWKTVHSIRRPQTPREIGPLISPDLERIARLAPMAPERYFSRVFMHELISRWTETAPYWEKHRAVIREMFAPVTQALAQNAEVARGRTILDVATGPGEPALALADLVGSGGKVLGIDVVSEMVQAARREADRRHLPNAHFAAAAADALPADANTFDAAVSRFGVMFFPSPVHAIREMLRVLKPKGRMALAVWSFADKNPFHCIPARAIERYVKPAPPAPDAPDAFRFAQPGKLRAILLEAGAAGPSELPLQFFIRARLSLEEFWTLRSEMSERLRNSLAKLTKEQMASAKQATIEGLRPYYANGGISIPAEVLIVSGSKPS
jgi:SAM-dependent methyltransferase